MRSTVVQSGRAICRLVLSDAKSGDTQQYTIRLKILSSSSVDHIKKIAVPIVMLVSLARFDGASGRSLICFRFSGTSIQVVGASEACYLKIGSASASRPSLQGDLHQNIPVYRASKNFVYLDAVLFDPIGKAGHRSVTPEISPSKHTRRVIPPATRTDENRALGH